MRNRLLFAMLTTPLVIAITGQVGVARASFDDAFWVSYWARPKTILNAPEAEIFYRGIKELVFARNVYDRCENPSVLDDDARWFKEHPNVHFYIDGYASKRATLITI